MKPLCVVCALAALAGCYPEPRPAYEEHGLSTRCGLMLAAGDELDLARLQRQEDITLNALSSIHTNVDWRRELTCDQLKGTRVRVEPLADGGMWSDDQFFALKSDFDRGRYYSPMEVVVTTYNWANPELPWQLVRVITRGGGEKDELLFLTGPAIADAVKLGRQSDTGTIPLQQE